MSCCEAVSFTTRMCPHVRAEVNTIEEKGTHYRYILHGQCDSCGLLSKGVRTDA